MQREAFLSQVRRAVEVGQAYRLDVAPVADDVAYVGADGDLAAALASQIDAVGGRSEIVADSSELASALESLLEQYRPQSVLCWRHPLLEAWQIPQLLEKHRIERLDDGLLGRLSIEQRRQKVLAADIGISSVDYAVAETGTLVVASRRGQERVTSLVPPVHVAVVAQRQIVPDLCDVFSRLREDPQQSLPSNLAFITGPSKTGDIELQLTTGVHGPGEWHVIIVAQSVQHGAAEPRGSIAE